ncbi:unnamed protein product [Albugo candida]|uniref:Uncharacterized protein n=1 Tax=Albugo candida TaxID=65357 RepID=A0A024FV20_9STRA|nr:unnamed protein product [Albugo candida]|eukprot:CCI10988.1 unnamed protein product [Albugo candida]
MTISKPLAAALILVSTQIANTQQANTQIVNPPQANPGNAKSNVLELIEFRGNCKEFAIATSEFYEDCVTKGNFFSSPTDTCRTTLEKTIEAIASQTILAFKTGGSSTVLAPEFITIRYIANAINKYFTEKPGIIKTEEPQDNVNKYVHTIYSYMMSVIPEKWANIQRYVYDKKSDHAIEHAFFLNVFGIFVTFKCIPPIPKMEIVPKK